MKMKLEKREIYYYETGEGFEVERLAGRFLVLLLEELRRTGKSEVIFLCIGTDRSTGDSLGPLIGYKLTKQCLCRGEVMGTLDRPVHAVNLKQCMLEMEDKLKRAVVIAVDASVGRTEQVGSITLGRGKLRPGLGVKKELGAVGDIFITGVVGSGVCEDPIFLQSVRLSIVMGLADRISRSICLGMSLIDRYVEKFSEDPSLI